MFYSATRGALEICDRDPANAANVILIYSRRSEPKSNFVRSPPQNATEWNREHLWPNSRGITGDGADYADLINLRPADVTVNNDRANLAFEETDPPDSMIVPGSPEAPQTSRDANSWEPPPVVKGDIARALFYMALRYDGDGVQEVDLRLTDDMSLLAGESQPLMGRLTTLLLWHLDDPVSPQEVQRNDCVQQHQGNRNPFIDCPEWAGAIYGNPMLVTGEVFGNQVKLTWWSALENAVPETSATLQPAAWTAVPGTPETSGSFKILTTTAMAPRSFYRIRYRGIVSP